MSASLRSLSRTSAATPRQLELQQTASRLFALRGFHAVSIKDITCELDISPMALYRHYPNKQALLLAILESPMHEHLAEARALRWSSQSDVVSVIALARHHSAFVLDQPDLIRVWRTEARHLEEVSAGRLRQLQCLYLEEWAHAVRPLLRHLSDEEIRTACRAAIAVIHSSVDHDAGEPRGAVSDLLVTMVLNSFGLRQAS